LATQSYSRSHNAVIHVYDEAGSVIETHEHKGEFKRVVKCRVVNKELGHDAIGDRDFINVAPL
jgi:hypothetical protein